MTNRPLSPKALLFCGAVASGHPIGSAALLVGYSSTDYAAQLMRDPRVKAQIAAEREVILDRLRDKVTGVASLALEVIDENLRAAREPGYAIDAARTVGIASLMRAGVDAGPSHDPEVWHRTLAALLLALEAFPEARAAVAAALDSGDLELVG
ncbi:hypothetical protein [Marmoricola sp. RAF53]|uniref:hypothetical protein n=1 Tax=Marmoricola sp. RAF53 TaxID=3233059 RepID=UPI003F9B33F9